MTHGKMTVGVFVLVLATAAITIHGLMDASSHRSEPSDGIGEAGQNRSAEPGTSPWRDTPQAKSKAGALAAPSAEGAASLDAFNSVLNRMKQKSISELAIDQELGAIAQALQQSPELREAYSKLYRSLPPFSLEKYLVQEMLEKSQSGRDLMRQEAQRIASAKDEKNYEHMLQMANAAGGALGEELTNLALNILASSDNPALLAQALTALRRDSVAEEFSSAELLRLADQKSMASRDEGVRAAAFNTLMEFGDAAQRGDAARRALQDPSQMIRHNALITMTADPDFTKDAAIKQAVEIAAYDQSQTEALRLSALKLMVKHFDLEKSGELNSVQDKIEALEKR